MASYSSADKGSDSIRSILESSMQGDPEPTPAPEPSAEDVVEERAPEKHEPVEAEALERAVEATEEPEQVEIHKEPDTEEITKWKKDAENFQKGMRKFQRERDELKKQAKEQAEFVKKYEDLVGSFKKGGLEDLVNTLSGKEDAWAEIQKRIEERAIRRHEADPSEIELLEREDELFRERQKRERAEKDYQEHLERIQAQEAKAQEAELRSKVNPAFDKYKFDGKLGNAEDEQEANDMVWNAAIEDLKKYATAEDIEDHEIPKEVIEATFKKRARLVGAGSQKQVKDVIEKKKEDATKSAQLKSVSKKSASKSIEEVAEEHMGNYNLGGLLRGLLK